jgi:hypothetical protein
MVADNQGCQYQGGIALSEAPLLGGDDEMIE